jgi:DNA repair exonuclease SbcCD ATPase subunit
MDLRDAISSESSGVSDSCDRARRLRTEHDHLQILHDRADGALADAGSVRTGGLERGIRELTAERDRYKRFEHDVTAFDACTVIDAHDAEQRSEYLTVRLREAGAECDALKAEVAALQRRINRLLSGDEIESDRLTATDDKLIAALAEVGRLQKAWEDNEAALGHTAFLLEEAVAEVERLKEGLAQIEHIDAGGCLDGDCPHDHANECLEVLTAELKFVGETVRALLTEGESEEKKDCNADPINGGCDCCQRQGVVTEGGISQPCHCLEGLR